MHLVDRHRRAPPVLLAARLEIFRVGPVERRRIGNDRRRLGPQLRLPRKRIGLERQQLAVLARRSRICRSCPARPPGMNTSQMPVSKRLRIGWRRPSQSLNGPTTETRRALGAQTAKCVPGDALELHRMGAELVEQPQMGAFADVVVVHRPEHRAEAVGIEDVPLAAVIAGVIADRLPFARCSTLPSKKPASCRAGQLAEQLCRRA